MSRTVQGVVLVIVSALGFGMMPIFALYAYDGGVNVATLLFLRFGLAAVALFTYLFGQKFTKHRITWPTHRQIGVLFLLGGVFYAMQSTFYFTAVQYISPGLAALVLYTYPVMVALLSVFVERELLSGRLIGSLAVSFAGVACIVGSVGDSVNPFGIGLALAAAGVYSVYILVGNRLVRNLQPITTTAFVTLFATASFFLAGRATGKLLFSFPFSTWLPIVCLVLFSTVFALLTFFAGLERIGSTRAAILSTMEPLITAVLSAALLKQNLTVWQAMGGLAVLAGAVLAMLPHRRHSAAA